jgi:hypothetical protein
MACAVAHNDEPGIGNSGLVIKTSMRNYGSLRVRSGLGACADSVRARVAGLRSWIPADAIDALPHGAAAWIAQTLARLTDRNATEVLGLIADLVLAAGASAGTTVLPIEVEIHANAAAVPDPVQIRRRIQVAADAGVRGGAFRSVAI